MNEPQLPNLELIESMHSFPGPFTFKVIGDCRPDFAADALNLAQSAVQNGALATDGTNRECTHSVRKSTNGHHIAVTLTMQIESAPEVLTVYKKLLLLEGLRALF